MKLDNALGASIHELLRTNISSDDWSIQGLGMLRLYLSREIRLHVWDSRFAVGGADVIHTHPWRFTSYVISGEVRQFRYFETERETSATHTKPFKRVQIKCGEGGGPTNEPTEVWLLRGPLETYVAGASYSQQPEEIHESLPTPGTVTVVERTFFDDADHALVYFNGDTWQSAEPRKATPEEVRAIVGLALQRWGL